MVINASSGVRNVWLLASDCVILNDSSAGLDGEWTKWGADITWNQKTVSENESVNDSHTPAVLLSDND